MRYSNTCSSSSLYNLDRGLLLTNKLLTQWFMTFKLGFSFRNSYRHHHELIYRYVSQIIRDLLTLLTRFPSLLHRIYSETCLNWTPSKPKTCLNHTDSIVPKGFGLDSFYCIYLILTTLTSNSARAGFADPSGVLGLTTVVLCLFMLIIILSLSLIVFVSVVST